MKKYYCIAIAVKVLLLCCIFSIHAMDNKQNHEKQTAKTSCFLNDEQLTKLFGKPVSELHNEYAKEKASHVTLLSNIRSHKQYRDFNFDLEGVMSKLIERPVADLDIFIIQYNQQKELLNDLYKIHLETAVYKVANEVLKAALEDIN